MRDHYVLQDRYIDRYNSLRTRRRLTPAEQAELIYNYGGARLHNLYWRSLIPEGAGVPRRSRLAVELRRKGGASETAQAMSRAAAKIQGSGWVALTWSHDPHYPERGFLDVRTAHNHDLAAVEGGQGALVTRVPLVVMDVWEHAWYLDRGPAKGEYFRAFRRLINWPAAAMTLDDVLE